MRHLLLTILLFAAMALPATNPWVGGLNACQFGRLDLDGDGRKDLLAFDRHGDRLLCFLNKGCEGELRYEYTEMYDEAFPKLHGWAVFADYDGDGREDIFTYSKGWAGIKVYRNTSTDGCVSFELAVSPYLTSWQGGGEVNILATDADYPAIVDIDGDGDPDLLTFGVMGTFIEKHVNLSMERFGHRDSLVFERTDPCWGRVAESEEDNLMYLDTCLFGLGLRIPMDGFRHRGATFGVRDLNGDGLLDLLLADVDYPGITLLINGGDADQALMVSQTDHFPAEHPVRLFSMPVPYFTDINNDGVDDLLVSPFDPDPMASVGKESVWLYLNHGTNEIPDFQLYSKSFLQDLMLDFGTGAYPVPVDWDGDGLMDLVVGTIGDIDSTWYNYGNLETHRTAGLTWLRNVGTTSEPAFHVTHLPLEGLTTAIGLVPAIADLDGDGSQELLVGTAEGRLLLYDHEGTLLDGDYLHYDKAWSAPCFFDVDQDGLMDLVVGNSTGKLSFYHGIASNVLLRGDDEWGGVDVRDYSNSYYGYSVPTLFQWGDEVLLTVGSESGKVFLYDGVGTEEGAVFREVPERWKELSLDLPSTFGMRSAVAVTDLNADGHPEIVVGQFGGGLQLYNADIPIHNLGLSEVYDDGSVAIFPNPVPSQLHIVSKDDDILVVNIIDVNGHLIQSQAIDAKEAVLEVSDLNEGCYLLRLVLERGAVNRTFLKR